MIEDFKRLKNKIMINLQYVNLVVKSLETIKDNRLTSNKLKRKSWLKKLY
jgi:hypothetical protein